MTTSWFFHQSNKFSVLNYDTVHSFFPSTQSPGTSFPQESHLPALRQSNFLQNGKPAYCWLPTPFIQDSPQGFLLSYFCKLLRTLSVPGIFFGFSPKSVYPTIVMEIFQIYLVQITEKCMHLGVKKLNLDIFSHDPR